MEQSASNLLRFIGTISRAINSQADKKYRQLNLQKGQYLFLTRICENPEINLSELSNLLKVDKTTTTKAVNKLEEIGYIWKRKNSHDQRKFQLFPTNEGLLVYDIILAEERLQQKIIVASLSENEIEMVTNLIEKMSDSVENYWLASDTSLAKK
ncbi:MULTISPECIES: MarR family winged helix-turn-helix transcriptional regulator [unclassified Enterococcus]|uniref:MarR family winged helix-turn-helix transcriptional regulator n=1 Tax=unclassified Enterococcus TaxID=2608891 RepID=UPI00155514BB|nr:MULTISPECIES: MarR family winged helix-turn-helix transcriptional regulator [unclassified Enterococcus]MBS7577449.1 winged helix-turn-helix transcriptional regulator [Enterococcus sp. MMGLQ5-2]MBS7584856.1 winged helix-turn-helix transcriptional regulator [Enterococcus sp. MMGLQ5-1]NPD12711.1 winged helix-turn-helix transcriptional regulator [Enterococcus sp. MMGLQ5-1]NPD37283.1 winged helix-turn-helix transcriptional regulator [Enterococcus sp. MMGLQ5-2]